MEKNNAWNIRCLVDDLFVPSSKQPGVLYCKLTYFYSFCGFLPTSFLVHVVIECPLTVWLLGSPYTHFWHENWALLTSQTFQKPMKACTQKVLCCCLWAKKLCPFQSWHIKHSNISHSILQSYPRVAPNVTREVIRYKHFVVIIPVLIK